MKASFAAKHLAAVTGRLLAGLMFGLTSGMGPAQALGISPVLVELSPAQRVGSVTLTNDSDRALNFQAETRSWTQPEGSDQYEESTDLLVVPPIAEIAPGASQIFRVTLRRPPVGPREQAYRLILEDVSQEVAKQGSSVSLRYRYDLPVFVTTSNKARARLSLDPCVKPTTGCVRVNNAGERYAVVKKLGIEGKGWQRELQVGARVLAGAWRQWTFDLPTKADGPVRVKADTSVGEIAAELSVSGR